MGDIISLTASVLDSADSGTGYGVIEEVRFFVNGMQQGGPDVQFPFVRNWNPNQSELMKYTPRQKIMKAISGFLPLRRLKSSILKESVFTWHLWNKLMMVRISV